MRVELVNTWGKKTGDEGLMLVLWTLIEGDEGLMLVLWTLIEGDEGLIWVLWTLIEGDEGLIWVLSRTTRITGRPTPVWRRISTWGLLLKIELRENYSRYGPPVDLIRLTN